MDAEGRLAGKHVRTIIWENLLATRLEKIGDHSASAHWLEVSRAASEMVRQDPEGAVEFGVSLVCAPIKKVESVEWRRRYVRGVGLTVLADDGLVDRVRAYLETGSRRKELASAIMSFINLKGVEAWSKEQALGTPEFFSMVQAMVLGCKAGGELSDVAGKRMANPQIWEKIGWYKDLVDTEQLFKELNQFRNRK